MQIIVLSMKISARICTDLKQTSLVYKKLKLSDTRGSSALWAMCAFANARQLEQIRLCNCFATICNQYICLFLCFNKFTICVLSNRKPNMDITYIGVKTIISCVLIITQAGYKRENIKLKIRLNIKNKQI
jgi:hypothetical protein